VDQFEGLTRQKAPGSGREPSGGNVEAKRLNDSVMVGRCDIQPPCRLRCREDPIKNSSSTPAQ
jgi:hypothetical protein